VLGLPGGSLGPGAPADLCVFDPDAQWTLDAVTLRSAGHNSPWLGARLRGRVLLTVVDGRVVHRADGGRR
jgi:dihydroorotase